MTRPVSDWGGNLLAFALTISVNAMATSIPLGGQTPREISDRYPSLFTPESFTFSIWGVIYLSLLVFLVYQALPSQRDNATLAGISPLFKLNCLANAAWILAWHYNFLMVSLLIMAFILATLVIIYSKLNQQRAAAPWPERISLHLPFSLYIGWISVAAIANFSTVQTAMGWNDLGTDAITWTLLKLALAGVIGAIMVIRKADIAFALVVAWAAYGISVKQTATPEVHGAASSLMLVAAGLAIYELIRRGSGRLNSTR